MEFRSAVISRELSCSLPCDKLKLFTMAAITLRQLEIFVQIVELGSFRRCADHIGISPVAISDHIASLERHLGVKLFDRRHGEAAQVNAAGEKVHTRALRILSELSSLEWEFTPERRGPIRKTVTLAAQGYVLRDLYEEMDRFRAEMQHIDLVIRAEPLKLAEFRKLLESNAIDLAYIIAVEDPGLFPSSFIGYEYLDVYVAPDHPLIGKGPVTPEQLQSFAAVRLGRNGHLREAVDDAMNRCGLGNVRTGLETDDYGLVLNTLQRTDCFACMMSGSSHQPLPHSTMLQLELTRPLPPLQLREAYSALGTTSPAVSALAQRIRRWLETR